MIGRPPPAYEKSVFINCPFDSEYRDLMLANVFSVSAHVLSLEAHGRPRETRSRVSPASSPQSRLPSTPFTTCRVPRVKAVRISPGSTCRSNSGWLPPFALSETGQIDRIDGLLSFLRAMPIKDSSPIQPGSIPRDTTPRCLRLFAKSLRGSGRWTMSWIQSHRPCAFFRASHLFAMNSPSYERMLLRRKRGPTFCRRLPRAFRSPKELLVGGRREIDPLPLPLHKTSVTRPENGLRRPSFSSS